MQQGIPYIPKQCRRGCVKRNPRLEMHTLGQTLCIIVPAAGSKDARGHHITEQDQGMDLQL